MGSRTVLAGMILIELHIPDGVDEVVFTMDKTASFCSRIHFIFSTAYRVRFVSHGFTARPHETAYVQNFPHLLNIFRDMRDI
jgi:hypothetical protein